MAAVAMEIAVFWDVFRRFGKKKQAASTSMDQKAVTSVSDLLTKTHPPRFTPEPQKKKKKKDTRTQPEHSEFLRAVHRHLVHRDKSQNALRNHSRQKSEHYNGPWTPEFHANV